MEPFIIISAYNEETRIIKVLEDLKKHNYSKLIVIDDGSTDNTKQIAKKHGAIVLSHIINRGRGAAVQTGFDYALKNNAEIVVTMDGDGQHQAKDIESLIKPIKEKKVDVVLGSRFLEKRDKVPKLRKFLLKGSILAERIFLNGIKLTDAHNGFRAFSQEAIKKINITMNDRAYCSDLVEQIKKNKLKYAEVPVDIIYTKETLKKGLSIEAIKVFIKMILKRYE